MTITQDLQCYRVGGSVRDELMGLPSGDRDWVVVGATPEQMIARGFRPVGKDFPVFLHPDTHEEYALARTERKTAPGYKGFAVHFAPDVTLEDDLLRRDITINAMAVPATGDETRTPPVAQHSPHTPEQASTSQADSRVSQAAALPTEASESHGVRPTEMPPPIPGLIDPFHGLKDLRDRIFRHVSPAFREDPVRILRVARFAARFPDFRVAGETLALMREMSAAGEVDALVPERVWQEISRGLMNQRPSRMLEVLEDSGALAILIPGLPAVSERGEWLAALDRSAAAHDPLPVRFAVMMAAVDAGVPDTGPHLNHVGSTDLPNKQHAERIEKQARQLRAANDCIDAARRLASELGGTRAPVAARQWLDDLDRHDATALLALFNRHDLWRRPERLDTVLQAALRLADRAAVSPAVEAAAHAAREIDTGQIAKQHAANPQAIRAAIDTARIDAITQALG
ncbi:MAG: multifunctional CCA tRNA nucleotidyl transferase/2'3'-cyclic phosphodiesterase/2'nucleotidase/phosphatase [Lautropia sp.]|nr:multifunctional CCA tRNA nucleotidyl transferase/2'3'-cyclic phosphodiesterase/2'nucleotidase/phosphatase [Lautropia sp.]